ncbi:MAG TPA: sugar phosphate nucleotidyltransferase [Candidatus Dormibacteraeota bacterium]|nr:sugar phosphate nucleotidyltransferase [Candidatus Dormibacteraeota bacterium]
MLGDLVTVILCGGRGSRAYPATEEVPKPLLRVGGLPVVEHVIGIYARRGCRRFVLATGYLGDRLAEHFRDGRPDAEVTCVDTGADTPTGERLRRCLPWAGNGTFLATYSDGLGDVDLDALVRRHRDHGRAATVTAVPLPSQYGTLDVDGSGRVGGFVEKPRLEGHWINAGFFVLEPRALAAPGADLEREMLPALATAGELHAYRHPGFWRSLDTLKDQVELDGLAGDGVRPPWW